MKLPKFNPGKKLQATVRRVRAGVADRAGLSQKSEDDYEEEEPNMRFSSAFMVVLLLHVTAFGGIWAFDKIKDHRVGRERTASPAGAQAISNPKAQNPDRSSKPESSDSRSPDSRQATSSPARTAATAKKDGVEESSLPVRPGIYTTVKGDNPVTIAHHLGVSYDDLLKLNNIEDPKKLQIGQKLRIPAKRNGDQPK